MDKRRCEGRRRRPARPGGCAPPKIHRQINGYYLPTERRQCQSVNSEAGHGFERRPVVLTRPLVPLQSQRALSEVRARQMNRPMAAEPIIDLQIIVMLFRGFALCMQQCDAVLLSMCDRLVLIKP